MKKYKKIIIIGIILLIVTSLLVLVIYKVNSYGNKNSDGVEIMREYKQYNGSKTDVGGDYPVVLFPKDNIMRYTTVSEVLDLFNNKKDAVIYFGYATCLYCRHAIEVLHEASVDTGLDRIYYLDVEVEDDTYDELYKILGKDLILERGNQKKINAPLVLFLVDGKIVSYHIGTVSSHDYMYDDLTNSQKEGLREIYKYGIMDVVTAIKYDNND